MQQCSLLSLAQRGSPHVVEQSEAKIAAREAFGGNKALFDRLSGVFDNAGIARRHIVAPLDWYMSRHGWGEAHACLSRGGGKPVRRGGKGRNRQGRADARADRRRRDRFNHRYRNPEP
jgi:hypothetical protein